MEDGETKEPKKKESFFKKIWNGIKAILSRFISFLKRKCKYIGLLVKMKKNPNQEVFCPLPLKQTYAEYVEFDKLYDEVLTLLRTIKPDEINDRLKYLDFNQNYKEPMNAKWSLLISNSCYGLKKLTKVYEKIDKGMDINDDEIIDSSDAGDKKQTKAFIKTKAAFPELFDYDEGALVPIKTIIENIENLNNIRKSISEKTGLILKMLEKYENTSSDNEYVNNVLKSVSAYKKPILDFMKLDMTLERCLNTQFEIFTKYSKKHSRSSKDKSQQREGNKDDESEAGYEYFYPNNTFDKCIKNKEKGTLRALLVGIIGSDPTFVTTEYDEAIDYIKRKSKEINGSPLELTESYVEQEDEYTLPREKWNEEYFRMMLLWYRDNFADERLQLIKKVGKEVYKNKLTLGVAKKMNRRKKEGDK